MTKQERARRKRRHQAVWRSFCRKYLKRHPRCGVRACDQPAEDVVHQETVEGRPYLVCADSNLLGLCRCHYAARNRAAGVGGV